MWLILIPAPFVLYLIFYAIFKRNMQQNLKGRHIVVTGGSSGIGKSVAIEAARRGANVTLIARDQEKLKSAMLEVMDRCIDKEKQLVGYLSMDLCRGDEDFSDHIERLESDLGPIFMLVNCAGTSACGKIEDLSIKDVKGIMDVNFFGTFNATRSVVPNMKKRRSGIIVLVGSLASLLGIFGYTAYSSSKFALRGLAEALHMEVCPYNMSVTLALPPDTDTPGFAIEEKSKLMETRLISNSAGLIQPEAVAKQLIDDALSGKFYSTIGFESFMLKTVSCAMTPFHSFGELICQVMVKVYISLLETFSSLLLIPSPPVIRFGWFPKTTSHLH